MEYVSFYFFIFIFWHEKVMCYNFDTNFPIIYKDPVQNENKSYFGYSLAMYKGKNRTSWIRIGAPKANDTQYKDTFQTGSVYQCPIDLPGSGQGCGQMNFPHPQTNDPNWKHVWNNSFIGGSMDVSYLHDRYVVCGYRHYYEHEYAHRKNPLRYESYGTCFWSDTFSNKLNIFATLLDRNKAQAHCPESNCIFQLYASGEAGFSVHLSEKYEAILGAPGIYNWAGTPIRFRDHNPSTPKRRKRENRQPFVTSVVPDASKNGAYNLCGYSVSSGHYFGGNKLYYASGSPKGAAFRGLVNISDSFGDYTKKKNPIKRKNSIKKNGENPIMKILPGEQFGEYFGASLASGAINADDYIDLLVGSPYYRVQSYNEGKVYLFLGAKKNLQKSTTLNGRSPGGQFGAAIMYLGDINNDEFGDVAIGAPYENYGTGTVYIYLGADNGLQQKPVQIIKGKEVYSHIRGFGISISRAVDMDENGYKDVSIGAYLSENAVFFRSRPLVVIKYSFISIPEVLSEETENFTLNITFTCQAAKFNYYVNLSSTILIENVGNHVQSHKNFSISNNTSFTHIVKVSVNKHLDPTIPVNVIVSYRLNYELQERNATFVSDKVEKWNGDFCKNCPLLDSYKSDPRVNEIKISVSKGCGGRGNECFSNLTVYFRFPDLRNNTFVLGSSKYIKLEITIKNTGQNAYNSKLQIVLPEMLIVAMVPPKCYIEERNITCDIKNPLGKIDLPDKVELNLEVKNLNNDLIGDQLYIRAKIRSTSKNVNKADYLTTLTLRGETDVTIYGSFVQESNLFKNNFLSNSNLTHKYTVEKFGDSAIGKLVVRIQVPHNYTIQDENITFLAFNEVEAYFGEQSLSCDSIENNEQLLLRRRRGDPIHTEETEIKEKVMVKINETFFLNCSNPAVTCLEIVCSFGPYEKETTPAVIKLKMTVKSSILAELAGSKEMVIITTEGKLTIESPSDFIQTGNRTDTVSISNIYNKAITASEPLALWIIIVAVVIGLLLLIILLIVLVKIGFFERKKKEELENLKAAAVQEDKINKNIMVVDSVPDIQELDPHFEEPITTSSTANLCEDDEDDIKLDS